MYVTLEPCDLCKSIIEEARISKVYYCIKKDRNKKFNTVYEPVDNYNIDVDEVFGDFFDSIRK
jgi:tRNA(Arg) A34 adenosine deaminase TadA